MRVLVTPRELMDWELWTLACEETWLLPWAVNEGMNLDQEIELTHRQAWRIGLTAIHDASADACVRCGRLPTVKGHHETVMMVDGGFQHAVCDDRWDEAP